MCCPRRTCRRVVLVMAEGPKTDQCWFGEAEDRREKVRPGNSGGLASATACWSAAAAAGGGGGVIGGAEDGW